MIVKIIKIYLGLSLVVLWAVWGQFIFGQFLGLAYISQNLYAPSYVVGTNRVLIYCTCHFQGGSLCFSFFCLLVSSVSSLGCMHLPGLSSSGSGTQVVLRGADSVGPAFCAFPRSEQLGCLASAVTATYRLSHLCYSVFWVYSWRPFSGGWRLSRTPRSLSQQRSLLAVWQLMSLWGCDCPLPALPALAACHWRGMVCSRLILFCPLFCVQSWWCLMLELFAWQLSHSLVCQPKLAHSGYTRGIWGIQARSL